jgi:hypothetical protein
MGATPDASTMMETYWDWQRWLDDNLCDEIVLKALNEESYRHHFCQQVIRRCRDKGVPVHFSPFSHRWCVLAHADWKELMDEVRECGVDGFVVYEVSSVYKVPKGGKIEPAEPEFIEYIGRHAHGQR